MYYQLISLNIRGIDTWFMQKDYANLGVTEQEEGGKVTTIGGVIQAPDNGKYWERLDDFLKHTSPDELRFIHIISTSAIVRALSPIDDNYDTTIVNYLRGYHKLHLGDYMGCTDSRGIRCIYDPIKTDYKTTIRKADYRKEAA